MPEEPTQPAMISVFFASSMVFTPVDFHTAMVSTVGAMEPIQLYFEASNCTPSMPTAWEVGRPFWIRPI